MQDASRGAEIRVEKNRLVPGKSLVKHLERAVRGAAKPVDGLIVVAYGGNVERRLHQALQQFHLRVISVLEFIHQHVAELLAIGFQNLRLAIEQPDRFRNQTAKTRTPRVLNQLAAIAEDACQLLLLLDFLIQQGALGGVQRRSHRLVVLLHCLGITLKIRRLDQLILASREVVCSLA